MRLSRPHSKRPPETIVALVDVVFFLLVFALLIGRMDATAPFSVMPPIAQGGADLPVGGLTISVSGDGQLALNGDGTTLAALLESTQADLRQDRTLRIRVNADAQTALRHVLPLIERLKIIGADDIVLIVTPELD